MCSLSSLTHLFKLSERNWNDVSKRLSTRFTISKLKEKRIKFNLYGNNLWFKRNLCCHIYLLSFFYDFWQSVLCGKIFLFFWFVCNLSFTCSSKRSSKSRLKKILLNLCRRLERDLARVRLVSL